MDPDLRAFRQATMQKTPEICQNRTESSFCTLRDTEDSTGSPFIWEYGAAQGWTELGVLDETLGFQRSGVVQFIGPLFR
jgi:hypothetical protein